MHGLFDYIDPQGVASWHQPGLPSVSTVELTIPADARSVDLGSTDLGGLTARGMDTATLLPAFEQRPPKAVSVPIGRGPRPRVRSFAFPSPGNDEGPIDLQTAACQTTVGTAARAKIFLPSDTSTRIKPPRDVVKLKDRLDYILQPSLETLMAERSLAFPFEPFPYQFEGVAFLYPRHAAILADEMGLGKTM